MSNNRIALGGAQFGMPYGVMNLSSMVSLNEATAIIKHARSAGMDTLDTAVAYGESEKRLGKIGIDQWQVISKLPEIPESCVDINSWVQEKVSVSLEKLRITRLYGLLVHKSSQLLRPQGVELHEAMVALKEQGLIEKIGISIYDTDELDKLLPHFQIELVQAPLNIMDRRLITSGWLIRLNQAGIEVHARSVFLQGLLLIPSENLPPYFNRWKQLWKQWQRWLDNQKLTPLHACLSFVESQPEINRVLVGVENLKQLREILSCTDRPNITPPETLMSKDVGLIDPHRWSLS